MTKCKSKDKIKLDLKYRLFVKKKTLEPTFFYNSFVTVK